MLKRFSKISVALSLCLAGVTSQADIGYARQQPYYRVQEINIRAARDQACLADYAKFVYVGSVNEFGYAVGFSACYKNSANPSKVARAIGGFVFAGLDKLPAFDADENGSWAYSVNNWGVAVGYAASSFSPFYGVRWTPGGSVQRTFEPETACKNLFLNIGGAAAINDRGTVAGFTFVLDPSGFFCVPKYGFETRSGERLLFSPPNGGGGGLNSINNKDIAVGIVNNDAIELTKAEGFISLYSGTADLAGEAYRINERDEVVGSLVANRNAGPNSSSLRQDPVWWDNKRLMHMLAMPAEATHGRPFDINEFGEIVGAAGTEDLSNSIDGQHTVRATLWRKDRIYDLNKYVLGKPVVLVSAWVINNYGQIYATGFDPKEPLKKCPISYYVPATSQTVNLPDHQCANEHLYLLTPVGF